MLERLKTLSRAALAIVALGCFAPAVAQAQESKITWRISQPGGDATQYKTQQAAVAGIKNPAPSLPAGVPVRLAVRRQDQVESRGLERKHVDHLLDGKDAALRP